MTATNHTEHYGLSQYAENDRPTYTGDYNADMSKIDAAIHAASQTGAGMTTVEHTADLTGDGTTDGPLGVADTIARIEDIPSLDGYATAESVMQAIASAIADRLRAGDIKAGNAISVSVSGNDVTIGYTGENVANGNVPMNTVSGTIAHADDAYPTLPRKVLVHGRTVENLWPQHDMAQGGITVSVEETGLISITGTETSGNVRYLSAGGNIPCSPGQSFTLSVSNDALTGFEINGGFYGADGWKGSFSAGETMAAPEGSTEIRCMYAVSPNATVDWTGRVMLVEGDTAPDVFVPSGVNTVKPEKLVVYGKSEQDDRSEVDLPSAIGLADGDTLTIDRDGTTRIIHSEGEPTVLANVMLPQLPAPTFNVYATGGSIRPTVDVNYERDMNMVIGELENGSDGSLSDRVTKLEQALRQPTPNITGLTAEQLDSQYLDDYNIVRVGTPTRSNESEVDPNE